MQPESGPQAFFLPVDGSARFCLLHLPTTKPKGSILYLHPFAEEMNRARSVAARQARAFAAAGYAVLQIDLHGCGDSAGDFGDATWESWLADAHAAVQLLLQRFDVPLCLWGLRSGALLASEVTRDMGANIPLLLWQPVLSGKQHLRQFLRLHLAAEMLEGRDKGSSDALMEQLGGGKSVEIAGYALTPALALGLASSELAQPHAGQRIHCIEVLSSGAELSLAMRRFAEEGRAEATPCVDAQCWLTPGVQACPSLQATSLAAMRSLLS